MAKKQARPGRTLLVFLLGTAILYGLVALAGATSNSGSAWKPDLGLDLQGGTRITLESVGNPSRDNLEEARKIIDARVNGSGISEAEVATSDGNIVVEIPGRTRLDLVETVQRTAQLRFRLVACTQVCEQQAAAAPATGTEIPPTAEPTPQASATGIPESDPAASEAPSSPAASATAPSSATTSEPAPASRVAPGFATDGTVPTTPAATQAPTASGTPVPSADPTADPSADPTAAPTGGATSGATPTPEAGADFDNGAVVPLDDAVAFIRSGYASATCLEASGGNPAVNCVNMFDSYSCNDDGSITKLEGAPAFLPDAPVDNPELGLVACSAKSDTPNTDGTPSVATKFLMSPAVIQGTELSDAGYGIPQGGVNYSVNLSFKDKGKEVFAATSQALLSSSSTGQGAETFAIVLDGVVLSSPFFSSVINDGNAEISGNFSEPEARSLSTSLKYGSLPIKFNANTIAIGPSLAGDQLSAGLTAGAFGLGLVLIYCLLYYRGLGLVVVASLLAASAVTYALVLLLSETAGFVLSLPGIAGLIIAVGITADSFIIFFERIRDEMREGKSMRVAVETGWKRAKVTRLAAQVVSLLSAAVLYIFATSAVKGFGFALGLTTLVDLAILFWFTKPMVSWLARFHFFNSGHRLSGLSKETLGIDGPRPSARTATTAGGTA